MSRGGVKTADVSAYLAETKGLERDYLSEVRKSEARAWWVARGAIRGMTKRGRSPAFGSFWYR